MPDELRIKLSEQLKFLHTSCKLYDEGDFSEYLRIATIIRILLHDTRHSTSLLKQLQKKEKIKFLSTSTMIPHLDSPDGKIFFRAAITGILVMNGVNYIQPHLSRHNDSRFLSFEDWWNEEILVLSRIPLSRRELVLNAANKNGGAHVDIDNLDDIYKKMESGDIDMHHVIGDTVIPITVFWHTTMRQIGYELLNTPELVSLVDR